jgi:hypothetical protein
MTKIGIHIKASLAREVGYKGNWCRASSQLRQKERPRLSTMIFFSFSEGEKYNWATILDLFVKNKNIYGRPFWICLGKKKIYLFGF